MMKKYEDAVAVYDLALKIDKDYATAHKNRGFMIKLF